MTWTSRPIRVDLSLPGSLVGAPVVASGTWLAELPSEWDDEACEFYLNDSSWCASNFLKHAGEVAWDGPSPWEALHAAPVCLCPYLVFRVQHAPVASGKEGP